MKCFVGRLRAEALRYGLVIALSAGSGCLESEVARQGGPEVSAARMGLRAEWLQSPGSEAAADPARFPYGALLRDENPVEFRVLSLANQSAESVSFYFGDFQSDTVELEIGMFCPDFGGMTGDGVMKMVPLCRYRSRWQVGKVAVKRQYEATEKVWVGDRTPTETRGEFTEVRPGETVEVVAHLLPTQGEVLESEAGAGAGNHLPIHRSGRDRELAIQSFLYATFTGGIRPRLFLSDGSALYLGEGANGKTFKGAGYVDLTSAPYHPGLPLRIPPPVSGIPVFE